jgi:hypothetical protein
MVTAGKWRRLSAGLRGGRDGAIAQLGERVVRNDEVGGSIPPGSTTLRPSGYAWRSRAEPEGRSVVPGVALLGEDGPLLKTPPHFPVNRGGRFSIKLATPSRKSLPRSATTISRLASMVASASDWNGTS